LEFSGLLDTLFIGRFRAILISRARALNPTSEKWTKIRNHNTGFTAPNVLPALCAFDKIVAVDLSDPLTLILRSAKSNACKIKEENYRRKFAGGKDLYY
jgi:hypothetical protein